MKRIILFFAVCLGLSVSQTTFAADANTTRSSQKRNVTNVVNSNANRSVTTPRNTTKTETSRTTTVSPRANKSVQQRTPTKTQTVKQRSTTNQQTNASRSNVTARTTTRKPATRTTTKSTVSRATNRAATLDSAKVAEIKSKNFSNCKTVYFECMDEFCANKDSNLRRCACSNRIHEFDGIQKQLDSAEDKMLNFNQRLLTVSMDKEDAAAINVATEGEIGYSTKDTTESEKLLQKIMKSLNSGSDSKIDNQLSPISLSLNVDSAWDDVDAMGTVSATSKSGTELLNAARPVCVEMAQEVCSADELKIAQDSYKLAIQQDCETVSKSYSTKYNQAKEKIYESSALLDMSRLNVYQQKNSDDTLTCKKKILEQLSNESVCGEDLYKCLDVTGQYIDPSNGNARLSVNLYNITTLITEPTGDEKWSKVPGNEKFVSFLNSKKSFLEPAMKQCQDISSTVWKEFLDDALSQIKLAQNAKLEEIRRGCTQLVAECSNTAKQDLSEFDVRALSIFSVKTDSTVNAMCSSVKDSCSALMDKTAGGEKWEEGISGIEIDTSYNTIIETCTTVGKNCIIQKCTGTAGNFALCNDFSSSSRRAILEKTACWQDVLDCVNESTNVAKMNIPTRESFYQTNYGIARPPATTCSTNDNACLLTEQIWGNCEYDASNTIITTIASFAGRSNMQSSNKILIPTTGTSLLSWLASNTGTTNNIDSCSAYNCPVNYKYDDNSNTCKQLSASLTQTSDGYTVTTTDEIIYVTEAFTNYCPGGRASKDIYGNCCVDATNGDETNGYAGAVSSSGICVPDSIYNAILLQTADCVANEDVDISGASGNDQNLIDIAYYCSAYTEGTNTAQSKQNKNLALYCITTDNAPLAVNNEYTLYCNGYLVLIDQYGNYITPNVKNMTGAKTKYRYKDSYQNSAWDKAPYLEYKYKHQENTNTWVFDDECPTNVCPSDEDLHMTVPTNNQFIITWPDENN